jgi:transcriptional regulator with XRE-family HTH domain
LKLPRLKEVRELHGWSQAKLAEESDVSRDSISNYETGQREAWPATAKKLADALHVEIADLREPARELATSGKAEALGEAGPSRSDAVYEETVGEYNRRHYGPSIIAQGWDRLTERWTQRLERGDFDQRKLELLVETLEDLAMGMEANAAAERKELVASYGAEAARDMSLLRPSINRLGLLVGEILKETEKAEVPVEPHSNVVHLADRAQKEAS